ncbi:unnamed protein product [Prunus brigantina]
MRAVILLYDKLSTVIKQAPLWNEFTCWKKFLEVCSNIHSVLDFCLQCHGFSFHSDTSHSNKFSSNFSYNYDQSHARRLGTESKKRYHPVVTNFLNTLMNFSRLHDYMTESLDTNTKLIGHLTHNLFINYVINTDPANVEYILKKTLQTMAR